MIHLKDHCANCSKRNGLIVLKPAYTYKYNGEEYQAYLCQYCRSSITKWKNKMRRTQK